MGQYLKIHFSLPTLNGLCSYEAEPSIRMVSIFESGGPEAEFSFRQKGLLAVQSYTFLPMSFKGPRWQ